LPVAVVVVSILWAKVPESRSPRAMSLDWAGAALATVGLAGLTFGLIEQPGAGWRAPRGWVSLAGGVVFLVAFALVEWRSAHPTIPPDLCRNRAFVGTNLLTLFLYAALSGALYFLPFDLIQVQGYSPSRAGAAILPPVLIMFALSRTTGAIADRIGPRIPLTVGPVVAAFGFFLLAPAGVGARSLSAFLPGLALLGPGLADTGGSADAGRLDGGRVGSGGARVRHQHRRRRSGRSSRDRGARHRGVPHVRRFPDEEVERARHFRGGASDSSERAPEAR